MRITAEEVAGTDRAKIRIETGHRHPTGGEIVYEFEARMSVDGEALTFWLTERHLKALRQMPELEPR